MRYFPCFLFCGVISGKNCLSGGRLAGVGGDGQVYFCSVLQRVAACCSALQRVAACCSVFMALVVMGRYV